MTNDYLKSRDEFVLTMGRELPSDWNLIRQRGWCASMLRLAQTRQSLAIAECNVELSKAQRTRIDNTTRDIESLCVTAGKGYGCKVGGDPRGCVVKLTVPSGYVNDFGREGICVPTK